MSTPREFLEQSKQIFKEGEEFERTHATEFYPSPDTRHPSLLLIVMEHNFMQDSETSRRLRAAFDAAIAAMTHSRPNPNPITGG
jgi:hypothetical protein